MSKKQTENRKPGVLERERRRQEELRKRGRPDVAKESTKRGLDRLHEGDTRK